MIGGATVRSIRRLYFDDSPARIAELLDARAGAEVADLVHALRQEAGLTQRELARKIGTGASVICRLENDEYSGKGIAMLRRIAWALELRVEVRLVPLEESPF
ncbi:MAG: helix-turn-helix transcriptional regulator [bacterium]|nr:helix-turn-helix transcriptional regulator [bacterium]